MFHVAAFDLVTAVNFTEHDEDPSSSIESKTLGWQTVRSLHHFVSPAADVEQQN